jgi:hypothetical protein
MFRLTNTLELMRSDQIKVMAKASNKFYGGGS